jgi:hypothetical protein
MQTPEQQQVQYVNVPKNLNSFGVDFKKLFDFVLEFAKNPVSAIKSAAEKEDFKTGIIFICVQAIIAGLYGFLNSIRVAGDLGGFVKVPASEHIKTLFRELIIAGVQYFLLAFLLFGAAALLFKANKTLKSFITVAGIATIPLSAVLLLNCLVTFIWADALPYISSFGVIASYVLCFVMVRDILKIDENKTFYIAVGAFVVISIIIGIVNSNVGHSSNMNDLQNVLNGLLKP